MEINRMTRREAVALAAATMTVAGFAADEPQWIDAHSHIWPAEIERYPLVAGLTKADLKPPRFTDDDLLALAATENVSRVVLIQHSIYHLFDNSYLVDAAARRPKQFRVVGMVDDQAPKPGEAMEKLLPQHVTGFRITPFIRKESAEKWLDSPGMEEMWRTAARTRQAMCCLLNPADLERVDRMCRKHPETPVVIDHFARIGADGEIREADVKALCALKRHKHVFVKISAFYALGKKQPPYHDLIPLIRRCYEEFGPQRLMWASDSPYQLEGKHTYAASIALVRDRLDFASASDRQWLLGKTAQQVYFP